MIATFKQFREAYDNLVLKGMKKLIVDVRNNNWWYYRTKHLYIRYFTVIPNQD